MDRGEWDKRKQEVKPHVPGFLHAWDPSWENNRLGFARWLASERSPLTARVAVNRMWQSLFGEGLVDVAEDFGNRTATPLQVELLDWLAVDFMEHHWSQKHLLKTIVTSGVYQQSSRIEPEALDRDPKNRWLARGPRFRCDAEVIRDVALRVSGLLVEKMGGPSVIPPVPQNVLDYNYVYPSYWTAAQSPERYRRTLYCFRKRSMPDPAMTSLDAPNGDLSCARRVRSNTPLAALTGWNEPIFVEAAQALALRILKEGGDTELERIQHAYRLCVSRLPSESEEEAMLHFLRDARKTNRRRMGECERDCEWGCDQVANFTSRDNAAGCRRMDAALPSPIEPRRNHHQELVDHESAFITNRWSIFIAAMVLQSMRRWVGRIVRGLSCAEGSESSCMGSTGNAQWTDGSAGSPL